MEIRWQQRFENFTKSMDNISETKNIIQKDGINKIYTMALIQAFEIAFELFWKTTKDYLEYNGIKTDTPRETIKSAFANNIIKDGETAIEMMEARNKTSHTYKEEYAKQLTEEILKKYIPILETQKEFFKGKLNG